MSILNPNNKNCKEQYCTESIDQLTYDYNGGRCNDCAVEFEKKMKFLNDRDKLSTPYGRINNK